ncbi:RNA methyltransferase [Paenibacillus sp. GP183]|uniref:TRM11 family SAM-dependent methyltransferase n=1 Tax=Paenibacillus sp. GP183 TaxID=1882751 RepID=UPI000897EB15|nr:RNA methyltransferase [Paenibacillus sp. GP183]SEC47655.1 tRNA G10 N-methylase Trm11 [Paenibacillus sp. GP183]
MREHIQSYVYTYICHEDERPLCELELRRLFGKAPSASFVESSKAIEPSRSPFIKMRLAVMVEGGNRRDIAEWVKQLNLEGNTFKIVFVECDSSVDYSEQRAIEREIGLHIRGRAEMRTPQRQFGIAKLGSRWVFGALTKSEAIWLHHNEKPQHYSTALSTRVARAVANIAVPDPQGIQAIDPCCGIGTVLIEALSMDMDIVGYDLNPLAVRGARVNLAHFGLPNVVNLGDIRKIEGAYDVLILDLPYNLCSVLPSEDQLDMLIAARRLSRLAVVVSTEEIDSALELSGFMIMDRCTVKKGSFARQVCVCL